MKDRRAQTRMHASEIKEAKMKRGWIVLILISMALIAAVAVAADNKGAKDMELNGGNKGNVPFPHHLHQDALKDCNVCHDVFPQKAGAIDDLKSQGKLESKQVMNRQCVKCHKEKRRAGEKTGPVTCSKCHTIK